MSACPATAWGYRDFRWSMLIAGIDPDPANAKRITTWAEDYWNALRPHTAGGAYVNFMVAEVIPQEQVYLAEQIQQSLATWIAAHLSGV